MSDPGGDAPASEEAMELPPENLPPPANPPTNPPTGSGSIELDLSPPPIRRQNRLSLDGIEPGLNFFDDD